MQRETISLQRYSLPGGLTVFCRTRSQTMPTISSRLTCFANFDSIAPPNELPIVTVAPQIPNQYRTPLVNAKEEHRLSQRHIDLVYATRPGSGDRQGTKEKYCLGFDAVL